MPRKLLLDTNVLIDIAQPNRPQHAEALVLLDEMAYREVTLCLSASSLKDVYYILCKCGMEQDAREYIVALMDAFTVLPIDEALCREAAASDEPDFEDAVIRSCAESAEVDFIISRDEEAFQTSPVKRLSTAEYIDAFSDLESVEL